MFAHSSERQDYSLVLPRCDDECNEKQILNAPEESTGWWTELSGAVTADYNPSTQRARRMRRAMKLAVSFLVGQGSLQAINIVIGLFLNRALSVEHYAQFGLAFGFQVTAGLLMDLGYASTIIPLVSGRAGNWSLVGSYLRASKNLSANSAYLDSLRQ